MRVLKNGLCAIALCAALAACGGSSGDASSSSGGGGGGGSNTNPATAQGLILGNVTPIPVVSGASTPVVPMVVINGSGKNLTLVSATLTGSGITGNATNGMLSSNPYVDTSACSNLSSQCNVTLRGYGTNPDLTYTISLTFKDTANGTVNASQVITYSSHVPMLTSSNGIKMAMSTLNNNLNKAPSQNSAITIPFVLGDSYTNLTASSTIPSIGTNLVCANNQFTANTPCYIIANIGNVGDSKVIASNLILSASSVVSGAKVSKHNLQSKATSEKIGIRATTNPSSNIPITISQTNIGNLITSAYNVVINPADGSAAQTLWVLNNGTANITNLQFSSQSSIITAVPGAPTTCGSTLAAGSSCSFIVNANSGQNGSGQSTVIINYSNGATQVSLPFNVVYIAATPSPLLSLAIGAGSLEYVPIGTTAYLPILVSNDSTQVNTEFTDIFFTPLSGAFSYVPESGGSSCAVDGSQSLSVGQSCTLIVAYAPSVVTAVSTFNILATANYVSQASGQLATYQAQLSNIPYSSVENPALLMIIPNNVSYAILANNQDFATESFTILNVGGSPALLPSLSPTNFIPATFTPVTELNDNCSTNTLNTNESCVVTFKFGPTTTVYTNLVESFIFAYKPFASSTSTVNAYSFQTFNTANSALINIVGLTESQTNAGAISGDGSGGSPFGTTGSFIASPTNLMWFNITYQNIGTQAATNFNIALNNLPVGTVLNTAQTSCTGVESAIQTLDVNESCVVSVAMVNPVGLFNPFSTVPLYTIPFPGWSYQDASTSVNVNTSPSCTSGCGASVNGNTSFVATGTPFATVASATVGSQTGSAPAQVTVPVTINATAASGVTSMSAQIASSGTVTNNGPCTITSPATSCNITLTFPADSPVTTYDFTYVVTPNGSTYPTGITAFFAVTIN